MTQRCLDESLFCDPTIPEDVVLRVERVLRKNMNQKIREEEALNQVFQAIEVG